MTKPLKAVYIKLHNEEDLKMYADFQNWCKEHDTDVTKSTKRYWINTVKEV